MENEIEKLMAKFGDIIQEHHRQLNKEQIDNYNQAIDCMQNIIDLNEEGEER